MSSPPPAKPESLEEDVSMQSREVTFRVEDQRFRLPIQIFGDSETFYAMLECAATDDPDATRTIHLDGISKDEFLFFVKYMNQRRLGGKSVINDVGYAAVLKMSTKWRFNTVRAMTIRDFPGVDVVDKIALARDYCVHEWLVTSLDRYARLARSITMQDVQRLGLNYVLKITQVRENFIQTPSYPSSSELSQRRKHDFGPALAEMFREEIKRSSIQLTPITPRAVEDFDFVDIFFLVEGHLFKSYRQCFEDSPVFCAMFSLPVGENEIHDGCVRSQPLRLQGIARSDFKPFVHLINPGPLPEINFSLAEWTSILKLSTMWEFTAIRQYAITQLPKLGISSAVRINLARDYHIQDWLLPGLVAYAQQEDAITADDVRLLGWESVLKILEARECMGNFNVMVTVNFGARSRMEAFLYHPGIEARVTHDFTKAIEEAFAGEIERVGQMSPR